MNKPILTAGGIFGLIIMMVGCGTVNTRSTVEQLTNARIAVEAAESVDAKQHDPENLRQAQDALAVAQDAYANQAFDRAFQLAKKSTIYSRLAKARTEQKLAEQKLAALQEDLDKVQAQNEQYMKSNPEADTQSNTPSTPAILPPGTPPAESAPQTQEGGQP